MDYDDQINLIESDLTDAWDALKLTMKAYRDVRPQPPGPRTQWGIGKSFLDAATIKLEELRGALSAPPPPPPNRDGRVKFCLATGKNTDYWTDAPTDAQKQMARDCWDRVYVFNNYWDIGNKLSWSPPAWTYWDIMAIYVGTGTASQHPEWILKDAAGNPLTFFAANQWAADIGNPAYRADLVAKLQSLVAKGYKLYLDDVNMNVPKMSGTPINQRTNAPYTNAAWMQGMSDFMVQIRAGVRSEIVHNSLWWEGSDGLDPVVQAAIKSCDVFSLERGWLDPNYDAGQVARLFAFIDRLHSWGISVFHLNNTGYQTAADAETNLAGALIASNGTDYQWSNYLWQPDAMWPGHKLDLGASVGPRTTSGSGVYSRGFTGGLVYFSAYGAPAATVTLDATYHRIDGTPVTSISLSGGRGVVLVKA